MDARPLTGSPKTKWKLAPDIARLAQGLVVSGFGALPTGRALFLEIERDGGGWLRALDRVAPVTDAAPPEDPDGLTQAAALAFTSAGLRRMGMPETALASFSRPFREGMFQEDRLRRLGDRRGGKWLDTVTPEGPVWSANTPPRPPVDGAVGAYDVSHGHEEEHIATVSTVHALLLVYTRDEPSAERLTQEVEAALAPEGVRIVRRLELLLDVEKRDVGKGAFSREHFGFADGLSQPEPFDAAGAVTRGGKPSLEPDPVQGVPLGELLLGYRNGHHEIAPVPVVPGDDAAREAGLSPDRDAQGFYDFGSNGVYMVVRELRQDVAAFWTSMRKNANHIRRRDPEGSLHVTSDWIAERVVGRNREGHLLCPGGKLLPAAADGAPDNAFLFLGRDPEGLGCPPGSHVRRCNPRDALAPNLAEGPSLLGAANNHRILRRGRKYGPKMEDKWTDDGADRGLLFICLNADIARQFEFVQQIWLMNSDFDTLYDEFDPLVGPDGQMTIREDPLRRTLEVETFVQMVGGDYFFLPSLPALDYLARL